jgi:hypothetical protein
MTEGKEKTCDHVVKIDFSIFEIKPTVDEKHTNKIELSDELGIVMRYPTFESIEMIEDVSDVSKVFSILSHVSTTSTTKTTYLLCERCVLKKR